MVRQKVVFACLGVVVGAAIFFHWLWKPERQARVHTDDFLKAVEKRNWNTAADLVAENYSDRWGHDKKNLIKDGREIFQSFFLLSIQSSVTAPMVIGAEVQISSSLKISGQGGPLAGLIVNQVNQLHSPFVFVWARRTWKPWGWELVSVDQPEVEFPEDF
jgi:hypothetical protein